MSFVDVGGALFVMFEVAMCGLIVVVCGEQDIASRPISKTVDNLSFMDLFTPIALSMPVYTRYRKLACQN
jgi:hypothetical protein